MEVEDDEILSQLKEAVGPVLDRIEKEVDSDRAAIVIAAKELHADGEYAGIQTFVDICGDYGIIGEALYSEMMEGIADGKPELYNLMHEVVKAIQKELKLSDDEPLTERSRTFH